MAEGEGRGRTSNAGKWMALIAALLGWMFDGLEMGLFPLVGRPALRELLSVPPDEELKKLPRETQDEYERDVGKWFAVAMAIFLVGAATGGVFFGWLGDRLGRVRAMMLSVFTYAIFSGVQGFVTAAWHIVPLRFIAAMGMGGEWSLGVALVNEIWPGRSRAFLAGLIGAAANVGFLLIAVVGRGLTQWIDETQSFLLHLGMHEGLVQNLTGNRAWRLLMILGAVPALLTFFIRIFVPESERWEKERSRGATSHWATRDLLGVAIGALGACFIIFLWAVDGIPLLIQIAGSLAGMVVVTLGYVYPVWRYLQRSAPLLNEPTEGLNPTLQRMLLGACLSGVPLLATWGSIQWAPSWADQLSGGEYFSREDTQFWSGVGAILGTIGAALLGDFLGRRLTYSLLCVTALASTIFFFQWNTTYGSVFLVSVFIAGGLSASFYGWLPLYLPELFRTSVRATGQGFSFNFGRILAAIGALQTGNLMGHGYPTACSIMSLIYIVGLVIIWFVPETKGKPLPD